MTDHPQLAALARTCRAHSSRTGEPCKRPPMRGQLVCRVHGGASPQARQAARERLAELVAPALAGLHRALKSKDLGAIVRAATVVLDRAGYGPRSAVELSGPDGKPVQAQNSPWVEHCTLEEKRALLAIGERATARMEGGEIAERATERPEG